MERDELLIVFWSQRVQNQESSSSLRVADVVEFGLSGGLENVVDEGGQVEVADFIPAELPEVLVEGAGRIQGEVVTGIVVSSGVT